MHSPAALKVVCSAARLHPAGLGPHGAVSGHVVPFAAGSDPSGLHGPVRAHIVPLAVRLEPACDGGAAVVQKVPPAAGVQPPRDHKSFAVQAVLFSVFFEPSGIYASVLVGIVRSFCEPYKTGAGEDAVFIKNVISSVDPRDPDSHAAVGKPVNGPGLCFRPPGSSFFQEHI